MQGNTCGKNFLKEELLTRSCNLSLRLCKWTCLAGDIWLTVAVPPAQHTSSSWPHKASSSRASSAMRRRSRSPSTCQKTLWRSLSTPSIQVSPSLPPPPALRWRNWHKGLLIKTNWGFLLRSEFSSGWFLFIVGWIQPTVVKDNPVTEW